MIYPAYLKKGDTIGVTATSSGLRGTVDERLLENAIANLKEAGYLVVATKNVYHQSEKLVSASAEERAKQFYELYCSPEVKHIVAASGGEFLMEILPWLEKYHLEEKEPKWVQGFSDTSLLLFYLTTKYHIATVHGTNFGGYGRKEIIASFRQPLFMASTSDESMQESFDMYEATPINWEEGKEFELPRLDTKVEYKNLYGNAPVKISGRLIGGCLDVLKTIIGTPYDYAKEFCSQFSEGMIWYLENCEMNVCDFYRTLWQMREAGWFANSNGFLIGRTRSKEEVHGFTYEDALHQAFDALQVPVIYDIDVGHTQLQWTIMNGSYAEFEYANGKGSILQKKI